MNDYEKFHDYQARFEEAADATIPVAMFGQEPNMLEINFVYQPQQSRYSRNRGTMKTALFLEQY
jgi:hypothetical protein